MNKYLVIYQDDLNPAGIYESEAVNEQGITCSRPVIHALLPAEGWTGAPFELITNSEGTTLVYL
jgi:hypothetical protein